MQPHHWDQFSLRVPIRTTADKIIQKWITQEGLESWFLRQASFFKKDGSARGRREPVEKGDRYEWLWFGWSDEVMEKGQVLSKDLLGLSFSFGEAGKVKVTIREEQHESILELLQYDIPTDESSKALYHIGCTKGWLFYLTNLKSLLEGGIDLRNRNVELKDVINS